MTARGRGMLCCALLALSLQLPNPVSGQYYKALASFTGVLSALPIEGFIITSPVNTTYDVSLDGPEEIMAGFEAVVQNNVLILGLQPDTNLSSPLPVNFTVRVPANKLSAISLTGEGIIEASGLAASPTLFSVANSGPGFISVVDMSTNAVQVQLQGNGTVYIEGDVNSVAFGSSGLGKGFVSGVVNSVTVAIASAGSVNIDSGSDTLKITGLQTGTGKVFYNSGTCSIQGLAQPCAKVSAIPLPYV